MVIAAIIWFEWSSSSRKVTGREGDTRRGSWWSWLIRVTRCVWTVAGGQPRGCGERPLWGHLGAKSDCTGKSSGWVGAFFRRNHKNS